MEDIEKARVIRDAVLAIDDVERITVSFGGAEYPAWSVRGAGWTALLSNAWDLHVATCRTKGEERSDRREILAYEHLRLMIGSCTVMNFFYETEGTNDHLHHYLPGEWEVAFDLARTAPTDDALDLAA